MWEVNHHTPCPPMSEFLSLKRPDGGEDDDDEEEIEMGGQTMEYKCPITLMPFVDAVKRYVCDPILALGRRRVINKDADVWGVCV